MAALQLDACGFAGGDHWHINGDLLGEIDTLEVHVQNVALNGMSLPVEDDHRSNLTLHVEVENRVKAAGAGKDLRDFLGAQGQSYGVAAGAIKNTGALVLDAQAASGIFATGFTGFGYEGNVFAHKICLYWSFCRLLEKYADGCFAMDGVNGPS